VKGTIEMLKVRLWNVANVNELKNTSERCWIGAVQHPRLAGQEQRSDTGVHRAADGRIQRTARLVLFQGTRRRFLNKHAQQIWQQLRYLNLLYN